MKNTNRLSVRRNLDFLIPAISILMLAFAIVLVVIAMVDHKIQGEASIGSFDVIDFNKGWHFSMDGHEKVLALPNEFDVREGQVGSLLNQLPDHLTDNMSLMIRSSMADAYIYIDDELREEYSSETIHNLTYYIPSAYVVTKLNANDSGKKIRIDYHFKSQGIINEITIGYGNDVWYPIIKNNLAVNIAAFTVLIFGLIMSVTMLFLNRTLIKSRAARYLGLLMTDVSLWVLSESNIRQIIFARASMSGIFAYLTVELTGIFACMYFDEVQHRKYHRMYSINECIMLVQILINFSLHILHIQELYKTLIFSHIWMAVGIISVMVSIIKDLLSKDIRKYKITAFGIASFLILAVAELAGFYMTRFHVFGTFACIGLVFLMVFTVVQALVDEIELALERERKQLSMLNHTIETIAGSIDAKDEYTGGHSERVGIYSEKLARKVAADYGFSEEDILRVKYIGFVHDIGKIGVADPVLNKAGRLTDEEFSLMKKHTEIGYEIMGGTGELMEGLLDGIRYHHERYDGKGYPQGLAGEEIPLIARILSLADSYDAMTSNRVYRKRLTDTEVRNELLRCAGTQFDPRLTEAFIKLIDEGELVISTEEGMATDKEGKVLISAKLENYLHNDLLANEVDINNPTHVRMMCYVIKLMEKKGKKAAVLFYGPDRSMVSGDAQTEEAWSTMNAVSKEFLSGQDIVVRYSNELNVMAVFEREVDEIDIFVDNLKEAYPNSKVFNIDDI